MRVLVLGSDASLKVRRGALELDSSEGQLRIDIDDPKPRSILFDGRGEFITGEALRWLARYNIGLIIPDGPGRILTFVCSALEATEGQSIPDTDPSLVRAQCAADGLAIAKRIVSSKTGGVWDAQIYAAKSLAQLHMVEAHAAADYWRGFADMGLREAKNGNLPRTWLRFANRQKGAQFLGSKHAAHPINAMLNYAYVCEAGRLAKALAARGFVLSIGFLHCDRKGRNSLVWDAIEPLRPHIDAKVFAYIRQREFSRQDFVQSNANTFRLSRSVIEEMLERTQLPQRSITEAVEFLSSLVCEKGERARELPSRYYSYSPRLSAAGHPALSN